jgi:hypothetical protein
LVSKQEIQEQDGFINSAVQGGNKLTCCAEMPMTSEQNNIQKVHALFRV